MAANTQQPCPWLNAATAAGALKGPISKVSVTYTSQENTDAICEFTSITNHKTRSLRIEVETLKDIDHDFPQYLAKCGTSAKPVVAIGNEALSCSIHKPRQISEQVVSRVREQAFLVSIRSDAPASSQYAIKDETRQIAEQVAGFLF
ncbi:MAG TPA: hypothetical protein VLK33_04790 [Terriglobales bacterium]|nr:hypothetical protein [Terriglobales bacterium]